DGEPLPAAGRLVARPGAAQSQGGQLGCGVESGPPLIAVGSVLLSVTSPSPAPDLATRPRTGGRWIEVNRPPRLPPARPAARFRLPAEPTRPDRHPVGMLMALVPVAGAGAMAFVFHTYYGLLFALLTPLSMIGARLGGRRRARRTYRQALAQYRREL